MTTEPTASAQKGPMLVVIAGGVVVFLAVGLRHSFGLFLNPVTQDLSAVNRETFGFALALQNLMWGLAQPIAGMIADRFGTARVVFVGGVLYASGLVCASMSSTALGLTLGFGLLVGIGLSATTYAVVLGAVGRRFPPEKRTTALALATLGGSIGIFLSVPITVSLVENLRWPIALGVLAALAVIVCFMSPLLTGKSEASKPGQSIIASLAEALRHRGYVLLILGFFVCGFQLAFIGIHLPAYLVDRQLDEWLGGAALATIGAANIVGTLTFGALGDRLSKKSVLAVLYVTRAAIIAAFVLAPPTPVSTLVFSAIIGFTWLGTVPLTTGIVAQIFGARFLATLVGIVFLMHQLGSFLGAWLGGLAFEQTGSYEVIWWSVIALGILAAFLHWPIDERPLVGRLVNKVTLSERRAGVLSST